MLFRKQMLGITNGERNCQIHRLQSKIYAHNHIDRDRNLPKIAITINTTK